MRLRHRSRLAFVLGVVAASSVFAIVSCSLDLDESKIGAEKEAGSFDTSSPEDSAVDAGEGGTKDGGGVVGAACTKNEDCVAPNACATAKCDLVAKRCVFDVCRPMACNAGACDPAAKTCGAPKPYTFKVAQFPVGSQVQRVAAVYPWLFVQAQTGVSAFDISNPTATAPRKVSVTGLGFVPTQMVATANRVFFITAPSGPANVPSTLPFAYVDVPTDPFAAKIEAHGGLATYSRPANEPPVMLPREGDTALLYSTTPGPTPVYHATTIEPPPADPATFTTTALVYQAGQVPANVVSGTRFLMQSVDGAGNDVFGLVLGAGSMTPMNGGVYSFADAGPVSGPQAYAMGPNGSVFWAIDSLNIPPGAPETVTRAARGQFLFANGTADYDRPGAFDIEVYNVVPVGVGGPSVGPVALLDPETALVLAAARENPGAQTSVQFAKRNPLGIVKNDNMTPRRLVLPVPIGTFVGAAGANGLGYAVANETMPSPNATVYVFDPGCAIQ